MSLKTEYSYNEDDFVQNGIGMQELTVTITLCEYRNLVKDISYQDNTIERLEEKIANLEKQVKVYCDFIFAKHPEITETMESLTDILTNFKKADHPTEKGGAE